MQVLRVHRLTPRSLAGALHSKYAASPDLLPLAVLLEVGSPSAHHSGRDGEKKQRDDTLLL